MKLYLNYKITNLIDGKVYIGYHMGNEDDGYLCSAGNELSHFWNAVRKYEPGCEGLTRDEIRSFYAKNGFINFKKETIQYFDDEDSMKEGERYWIAFYRNLLGKENVYNISDGGDDGWTGVNKWLKDNPDISSDLHKKVYYLAKEHYGGEHPGTKATHQPDSVKKATKTRYEIGLYDSDKASERTKKGNETKRRNGYFDSEEFLDRLNRLHDSELQHKASITKHAPDGYYNSEKFKEDHRRGHNTRVESGQFAEHLKYMQELARDPKARAKAAIKMKEPWVYELDNKYFIKTNIYPGWKKKGCIKHCRLIDWDNYCLKKNIDPLLLNRD